MTFSLSDRVASIDDLTSEQRELLALYGNLIEGLNDASCYEISKAIVDALQECRSQDKRTWNTVRKSPLMLNLYLVFKNDPDLWLFVVENQAIAEVVALSQIGGNDKNGLYIDGVEALVKDMRFARENKVFLTRLLTECVKELERMNDDVVSEEEVRVQCYRIFRGYANVFKTVAEIDGTINLFECCEVIMSNLENRDFLPEIRADGLANGDVDVAKGVALCELRQYHNLWNFARSQSGVLSLSSVVGAKVVDDLLSVRMKGVDVKSLGLPMFLLSHYYRGPADRDLLLNAVSAIVRYQEVALYLLGEYASNKRFCDYLAARNVGARLVPLFVQCCSEKGSTQEKAFEQMIGRLEDDAEGWLNRCVDKDGNMKHETLDALECLPMVGGIYGVVKHKLKGEAVTWGEWGWVTFDAAEIVTTVLTLGFATTETTAAKTAAKTTAKVAGRAVAKTIAEGGSKRTLKYSAKAGFSKVGRIARFGEVAKNCIRIPVKICGGAWSAVKWTGGKAVEGVRWFRAQPKWVKLMTLGVMLAIEINGRNLVERFPPALESLMKQIATFVIKGVVEISKGIIKGVVDGIKDCAGVRMESRWVLYVAFLTLVLLAFPCTLRMFPAGKRLGQRRVVQ